MIKSKKAVKSTKTSHSRPQLPQQLAHISRNNYRIILSLLVLVIIIINLLYSPSNLINQLKNRLVISPNNLNFHLQLGRLALANNDLDKANSEILKALEISNTNESKEALKEIKKRQTEPGLLKQKIQYWESVVYDKPQYRDAYLQLALLNWQIYQEDKARLYLNKALEIDPNFEAAGKIDRILKNQD